MSITREALLLALDKILAEWWKQDYSEVLAKEAGKAYIKGDAGAHAVLGMQMRFNLVSADAEQYSQEYRDTMQKYGGSRINGQVVPWVAQYSEKVRDELVDIIMRGIESGDPTGVKERAKGGYPEGTIAYELERYFDERRSHATTVARTEVGRIMNQSAINRYRSIGVEELTVLDNEGENSCEECAAINGAIWTTEYAASNELEHPNCVRAFAPVPPKNIPKETPGSAWGGEE